MSDNQFLWNQFCRLGEMIGDNLHLDADGKWITKEYKRLQKILLPEDAETRKMKRFMQDQRINREMEDFVQKKRCPCGGELRQSKSGSRKCCCQKCNEKYKAKYRRVNDR